MSNRTTLDRLSTRIAVQPDGCWHWTGWLTGKGYGQVGWQGHRVLIHRLVYELSIGPIPDGAVIDHLCRVRHCVNPHHLEAVTNQANVWRGIALVNNTTCRSGRHTVTSTSVKVDSEGRTRCIECRAESRRRADRGRDSRRTQALEPSPR